MFIFHLSQGTEEVLLLYLHLFRELSAIVAFLEANGPDKCFITTFFGIGLFSICSGHGVCISTMADTSTHLHHMFMSCDFDGKL